MGIFWFAWTSRQSVHWIVPIIGAIPFAIGNLSIFVGLRFIIERLFVCCADCTLTQISACMYLVDTYGPLNGSSALAANGLLRYTLSAVFPLFTVQSKSFQRLPWRGIADKMTSVPDVDDSMGRVAVGVPVNSDVANSVCAFQVWSCYSR